MTTIADALAGIRDRIAAALARRGAGPQVHLIGVSKKQPLDKLLQRHGLPSLQQVEIKARGVSGRVSRLQLTGGGKTVTIQGELQVRRALGSLRSALFVLELGRDASGAVTSLVAVGGGHGHGIGMCQYGAAAQAEAGRAYRDILSSYYQGAKVKKLY